MSATWTRNISAQFQCTESTPLKFDSLTVTCLGNQNFRKNTTSEEYFRRRSWVDFWMKLLQFLTQVLRFRETCHEEPDVFTWLQRSRRGVVWSRCSKNLRTSLEMTASFVALSFSAWLERQTEEEHGGTFGIAGTTSRQSGLSRSAERWVGRLRRMRVYFVTWRWQIIVGNRFSKWAGRSVLVVVRFSASYEVN